MTNDKRKHYTKMSETEKAFIKNMAKRGNYRVLPHAKERMQERRITALQIAETVGRGEIVEVHNNVKDDVRVLFRKVIGNNSYGVVISLVRKTIHTAYKMHKDDNHSTLNTNLYKWNVDLMPILKNIEVEGKI